MNSYIYKIDQSVVCVDPVARMIQEDVNDDNYGNYVTQYIPTLWQLIHEVNDAYRATSSFRDTRIQFYIPYLDEQLDIVLEGARRASQNFSDLFMRVMLTQLRNIVYDIMRISDSIDLAISYGGSSRRVESNYGRWAIVSAFKTMKLVGDYLPRVKIITHQHDDIPEAYDVIHSDVNKGLRRGDYSKWDIYLPNQLLVPPSTIILGDIHIDFDRYPLHRLVQMEERNILECVVYGTYDWFLYDDLVQFEEILGDAPRIHGDMKYMLTVSHFDDFIRSIFPKSRSRGVGDYVAIGRNRLDSFLRSTAGHTIVRYEK